MIKKALFVVAFMAFICGSAFAADFSGKWTAQAKTPGGTQDYVYEIQADGDKVTGSATCNGAHVDLLEVKVDGDKISFTEPAKIMGMDIKVLYSGKLNGDQIKFARKIGVLGNDELIATKVK